MQKVVGSSTTVPSLTETWRCFLMMQERLDAKQQKLFVLEELLELLGS